jgi:glycine cleavage system H protein
MSTIPKNLKYTESHEWIQIEGAEATVGITDHAQHALTDIVFVELPQIGKKLKAGEVVAVLESVKVAADIYSPVSGEVIQANTELSEKPSLINEDPYGKGWIFKIKPSAVDGKLLDAAEYGNIAGS